MLATKECSVIVENNYRQETEETYLVQTISRKRRINFCDTGL